MRTITLLAIVGIVSAIVTHDLTVAVVALVGALLPIFCTLVRTLCKRTAHGELHNALKELLTDE